MNSDCIKLEKNVALTVPITFTSFVSKFSVRMESCLVILCLFRSRPLFSALRKSLCLKWKILEKELKKFFFLNDPNITIFK